MMNAMNIEALQHWHVAIDDEGQGVAWVTLDTAGESKNVLSKTVMSELSRILDAFERKPPQALIFRSGKPAGFIAGADIEEFTQLDSTEKVHALVERGWHLFNRLASVPYPTLALVRGHCLGGGLELALACRYLLAVDEPGTKMGLPEVLLGIFPGWGGMLRLPARIGPSAALDMMLTGRALDAKRAHSIGLADDCVPPRVMENAARQLVLSAQARRPLPFMQKLLNGPFRFVVASRARQQLARRVRREHYPAPYAIIDVWARHGGNALAAPEQVDCLVRSPAARNLVRVFFLQERLKSLGRGLEFKVGRVHVVGAGVMGGDIAAWCALCGLTVTLQDQSLERIVPAIKRARDEFARRIRDRLQLRAALDRLIPDPEGHGAAHADVVIEAIFENAEAKQALLRKLDAVMRPDAVLATNTSSLRLEDLSMVLKDPARLVGIHFFNPVAKMPLVEVVSAGTGTDTAMTDKAIAFVRQIDRLPLPVRSAPGFLVNAVLGPYMLEALRAVDEGLAPETVDAAMLTFGMPMGPVELVDMVGLDVVLSAGSKLAGETSSGAEPPACLVERFNAGHLGRKTGQGFYAYSNGKPVKAAAGAVPEGLSGRLLGPLLARTQQLVAEGIVADADLADAGVIFGTGFAPFTGGPLNYLNERNV